jgi:hypothetical protein
MLSIGRPLTSEGREPQKKRLTLTDAIRTLVTGGDKERVDASVKKLLAELKVAEAEQYRLSQRIRSILSALAIVGVRPYFTGLVRDGDTDSREKDYASRRPFENMKLSEVCEKIVHDYKGHPLRRSQVEYLATIGGYEFETKDVSNSVDVTLRRLASAGKIVVHRRRGSGGSQYGWPWTMNGPKQLEGDSG